MNLNFMVYFILDWRGWDICFYGFQVLSSIPWGLPWLRPMSSFRRKHRTVMNSFAHHLSPKHWPEEDWDHQSSHPRALILTWKRSLVKLCRKLPSGSALTSYCQMIYFKWEDTSLDQEREWGSLFLDKLDQDVSSFWVSFLVCISSDVFWQEAIMSFQPYFEIINKF